MAQYKVPQDVEADDKLIGPFGFRQFIYLVIAAAMIALMVALFQIFPLLAILPIPVVVFFGALALPLKKDQPMETYLAAVVSYYLKPRRHIWIPGQREHSIEITVPKKVEGPRTRDISGEEASHRLSFLADIVDTEGRSIKSNNTSISTEFIAENADTQDMFETVNTNSIDSIINRNADAHRAEVINNMRHAIDAAHTDDSLTEPTPAASTSTAPPSIGHSFNTIESPTTPPSTPSPTPVYNPATNATPSVPDALQTPPATTPPQPALTELAHNSDFTVSTIQKEANRINDQTKDNEVYISLH